MRGEPWSTECWVHRKEEDERFTGRIVDLLYIHNDVEITKTVKNAIEQKKGGVVLLLPGQWLGGTTFKRSERLPIYLTEPEIQSLMLMSAGEDSELKRLVHHLDDWKQLERGLAHGAPNMLIPRNLESSIHLGVYFY